LFWIIFFAIAFWAIIDRFTGNIWPLGVDNDPFTGNWAVKTFDIVARISGRLSIVTTNALFVTMCRTTWEVVAPRGPRWIEFGDIRSVNTQIHYFLGIVFMAIPMLLHVWTIFLPAVTGVQLSVFAQRPPGLPFYTPEFGVSMASNDVFRLVEMTVLFLLLFPLSMSNRFRGRFFTISLWTHIVAAFLYFIDLVRQPSHPHAEIFNSPVVAYWIADRLIGLYMFRAQQTIIVHKEVLDEDYVIVLCNVRGQKRNPGIGSAYWFSFSDAVLETSHPFTVFQNRAQLALFRLKGSSDSGHAFNMTNDNNNNNKQQFRKKTQHFKDGVSYQSVKDAVDFLGEDEYVDTKDITIFDTSWTTALIVQIHGRPGSWTRRLADAAVGTHLDSWGPYTTEYRQLSLGLEDLPPLVLIATGAGAAFIVDFYMYVSARNVDLSNQVDVFFSTNSMGLFQFFTDLTCSGAKDNWNVNAHLTRHDDEIEYLDDKQQGGDVELKDNGASSAQIGMHIGRLSFKQVITNAALDSEVYFCGSPTLQWQCKVLCAERNISFHEGHTFSTRGMIKAKRAGSKCLCKCTGFPCCWCY